MRNQGFTFLELLLVISIISVIGAMSAIFYSRFLAQNAVSNTVEQLSSQLRKAQTYAMAGKQNSAWGVKFASNKITLYSASSAAFDENFAVSSNVSVTGFTQVLFARATGIPDSTPTITITQNDTTKTVTVNAQGMVTR